MPTSYMTDPRLLESLVGQQYVVLRPVDAVAAFYEHEQSDLLARAPGPMPHPNTGHVTLRGFYEPDRIQSLRQFVESWAASTPSIELQVEAVDGFPSPFQVLIARLARTRSLVEAYAGLTESLDSTDFLRIGELPLEEWVFHLSLAYAAALDDDAWRTVLDARKRDIPTAPRELVPSVDFVWYDGEGEHVESFSLQGR